MSLHHMIATFSEEDMLDAPLIEADMRAMLAQTCDEVHVNPVEEHEGYFNERGEWVSWRWYRILASGWIWSLN